MFRGRNLPFLSRITLLIVLSAPIVFTGCIFSPEPGPVVPPQSIEPPVNPTELIERLSTAYLKRDIGLFRTLLANDSENKANYLFILSEPSLNNETQWGFTEEERLHRRMFSPESLLPGEPEVLAQHWLESISIILEPSIAFKERRDLYESAANPDGLDPNKWKAMDSKYTTFVLFDMQGEVDFLVEGEANFIVIEDLEKESGTVGKFLIYRWEDLDTQRNKPTPDDSTV